MSVHNDAKTVFGENVKIISAKFRHARTFERKYGRNNSPYDVFDDIKEDAKNSTKYSNPHWPFAVEENDNYNKEYDGPSSYNARGGYTVAIITYEQDNQLKHVVGVSICSPKDFYCKRTGRMKAIQNAKQAFDGNKPIGIPAQGSHYVRLATRSALGTLPTEVYL